MCLAAVRQNGFALEYVKDRTDEIGLAAVQQNRDALEYVSNHTTEICFEAIKQDTEVFVVLRMMKFW